MKAYSIEAFACHFLTDLFAGGHNRNPRGLMQKYIADLCQINWFTEKKEREEVFIYNYWASLLTLCQHQEDGNLGLMIDSKVNQKEGGQPWKAYGDANYYSQTTEKDNRANRAMVQKTLLKAVQEIYEAYTSEEI